MRRPSGLGPGSGKGRKRMKDCDFDIEVQRHNGLTCVFLSEHTEVTAHC